MKYQDDSRAITPKITKLCLNLSKLCL